MKNFIIETRNNYFENKIIKKIDYVILNSIEQQKHMLEHKENVNYIVLPHSYDEKLYKEKTKKENKKIVISYFGHLDEIRNINLFLKALNELVKEDRTIKDKLTIELYGNIGKTDSEYIKNNNLKNIIKYGTKVNYTESLEKMQSSDWLLLVDANLSSQKDEN